MDRPQNNMVMYRQKRLAFTVVELLVAMSMVALILGAVYGSYTATTKSVARCKPKSVLQQQARVFLQRLTRQIRCCYAGHLNKSHKSSLKHQAGEDVLRRENPPLFIAKRVLPGQTFLRFVTSAVTSKRGYSPGGLAIVSYGLDESGTVLLRNKRRYYVDELERNDNNYEWLTAFENVQKIVFEYFDGKKWQQKWNSNQMNGLPQAVRVSLVIETEQTGPLSFVSAAQIACRGDQTNMDKNGSSSNNPKGRVPRACPWVNE